jgi:hypothetical protein
MALKFALSFPKPSHRFGRFFVAEVIHLGRVFAVAREILTSFVAYFQAASNRKLPSCLGHRGG